MASYKVMASSSSGNSDINRHQSVIPSPVIPNYAPNPSPSIPNYVNRDTPSALLEAEIPLIDAARDCGPPSIRRQASHCGCRKSERKECKVEAPDEMMTLEDFLAKAGAVEEEDVKPSVQVPPMATTTEGLSSGGVYAFDPVMQCPYPPPAAVVEVVAGRGKRRGGQILEPIDSLVQQRQKRMIKNRETAARSREKMQAYQEELESLMMGNLEEEIEQLQREKLERKKERYKKLMEKVVPVFDFLIRYPMVDYRDILGGGFISLLDRDNLFPRDKWYNLYLVECTNIRITLDHLYHYLV